MTDPDSRPEAQPRPLAAPPALPALALWALLLACSVPTLLAYNQPPSATLLNQCMAVALWGGVALALAPAAWPGGTGWLLAALAVVAAGAAGSWGLGSLPLSLALQALGLLAGAALMALTGAAAARQARSAAILQGLALGLFVAGLLGSGVALVQVFAPGWTDGNLIAHSGIAGRGVGNLRQPNHLGSLLLWALVAAALLLAQGRLSRGPAWAGSALLVLAIELTASRTGAVGLGLLLLWGAVDKRLGRPARTLLVALPLLYGLAYVGMGWWGDLSHQTLGAGARVAAEAGAAPGADSPNSRLNIWRNTLDLIAVQPWGGVGFGEFNLAWTLTAFPNRPTAFFDHTHNLPLQLAVELGLPAAAAVMLALAIALWQAGRRAWRGPGQAGQAARAAWMLVLLVLLHSAVEYPLWYAYFLLPAALAWGYALGQIATAPGADDAPGGQAEAAHAAPWALAAALLMTAGGAWAVLDYQRVVVIYAPGDSAGSLGERIQRGQRSPLFGHHADYAAATNEAPPSNAAAGLARASHSLLDTRLMLAWARHLAANGQTDRARWVAQRLREFKNSEADSFFAPCAAGDVELFQCQTPLQPHGWREFSAPAR